MNLEGIIAVTGRNGLHKVVARSKNGLIVESLEDGKRVPIFSTHQISALDEVSVFTTEDENIAVKDIFTAILKLEGNKATSVSVKDSPEKQKEYFIKIVPNYDTERVYISHIKKVIGWYNQLLDKDLLKETEEKKTTSKKTKKKVEETAEKEDTATKKKVVAPAKKTVQKAPSIKAKPAAKKVSNTKTIASKKK